jgi:DNA-binding NtrC family response regulator
VATNSELKHLSDGGNFRQDLYYRLRTHHVHIPPLRERTGDIAMLLDHYVQEAAQHFGKPKPTFPPELSKLLAAYNFPGNIRELRAMVYDAVGKHASRAMSMNSFREHINETAVPTAPRGKVAKGDRIFEHIEKLPALREVCSTLVAEAMLRSGGNQRIASAMLGITPPSLNRRLKGRSES